MNDEKDTLKNIENCMENTIPNQNTGKKIKKMYYIIPLVVLLIIAVITGFLIHNQKQRNNVVNDLISDQSQDAYFFQSDLSEEIRRELTRYTFRYNDVYNINFSEFIDTVFVYYDIEIVPDSENKERYIITVSGRCYSRFNEGSAYSEDCAEITFKYNIKEKTFVDPYDNLWMTNYAVYKMTGK